MVCVTKTLVQYILTLGLVVVSLLACASVACVRACVFEMEGETCPLSSEWGNRILCMCEHLFLCMWVVQIYRCVHMFALRAKSLMQVDQQSDRRPRTV